MTHQDYFKDFVSRFTLMIKKNPELIKTTLSNIFTMRLIGNKTHGDLAEIGISEFINQFMYDFKSKHVGKDLYRSKKHEEDITITNEIKKVDFSISLKAYGIGPLQLSTDKNAKMFPFLKEKAGEKITDSEKINYIFSSDEMSEFNNINVLPLIYNERERKCNILIFDFNKAMNSTNKIEIQKEGGGRKHPVYKFYHDNDYICEVRYGGPSANALQRGLWTHTINASEYFTSATGGWIDYSDNSVLVDLFSHALISTTNGHEIALEKLKDDIKSQKSISQLEDSNAI